MARLTAEQQEFVEKCWRHTARIRSWFALAWPGLDYDGAVSLRLCTAAPHYDPQGLPWRKWAEDMTKYACLELRRKQDPKGYRRKKLPRPAIHRVDPGRLCWVSDAAASDDARTAESTETALVLLRGLNRDERHMIAQTVIFGRRLKDAARDLGLSEQRGCQIRMAALNELRQREGLAPC